MFFGICQMQYFVFCCQISNSTSHYIIYPSFLQNNVKLGISVSDSNDFHNKKISKSSINETTKNGNDSRLSSMNTVNLIFLAEKAGNYTGQIVIYTPENVHDVRVLEIKTQVIATKKDLIVFFKSPARKEKVQVKKKTIMIKNNKDINQQHDDFYNINSGKL